MKKLEGFNTIIRALIAAGIVIVIVVIGVLICRGQINKVRNEAAETARREAEEKALLEKRVEDILAQQGKALEEKSVLEQKIDELSDLLTVEVESVNAETLKDDVRKIGELATIEYRYTNVGTIDDVRNLKWMDWQLPGTKKSAVVVMDGVIKAGVEVDEVEISVDTTNYIVKVTLPDAKIFSNELDENSFEVFDESSGIFNRITLDDSSTIRTEIKNKAESKAIESGVLGQAKNNAKDAIRCIMEANPTIKEHYTIEFK